MEIPTCPQSNTKKDSKPCDGLASQVCQIPMSRVFLCALAKVWYKRYDPKRATSHQQQDSQVNGHMEPLHFPHASFGESKRIPMVQSRHCRRSVHLKNLCSMWLHSSKLERKQKIQMSSMSNRIRSRSRSSAWNSASIPFSFKEQYSGGLIAL